MWRKKKATEMRQWMNQMGFKHVQEAADALGVSVRTVWKYYKEVPPETRLRMFYAMVTRNCGWPGIEEFSGEKVDWKAAAKAVSGEQQ